MACNNCGLHFKSATMSFDDLVAYYHSVDFTPYEGDYNFPTDAAILSWLRSLPEGAVVLDFGCSTGRILGALGDRYHRYGIELSERAAALARTRGIAIVKEEDVLAARLARFDAIVLSDVFEHLFSPTSTLSDLTEHLAEGGVLILVTGLADTIDMPSYEGEHWYYRVHAHLQVMTHQHAEWLAERLGLGIVFMKVLGHYSIPWRRGLRQRLQSAIYRLAKAVRRGDLPSAMARVPPISRAVRWTNAPATDYQNDHVLLVMRKGETRNAPVMESVVAGNIC
jgi:SAM-dependent methyltransferase